MVVTVPALSRVNAVTAQCPSATSLGTSTTIVEPALRRSIDFLPHSEVRQVLALPSKQYLAGATWIAVCPLNTVMFGVGLLQPVSRAAAAARPRAATARRRRDIDLPSSVLR